MSIPRVYIITRLRLPTVCVSCVCHCCTTHLPGLHTLQFDDGSSAKVHLPLHLYRVLPRESVAPVVRARRPEPSPQPLPSFDPHLESLHAMRAMLMRLGEGEEEPAEPQRRAPSLHIGPSVGTGPATTAAAAAPSAPSSAVAAPDGQWSCPMCTLFNPLNQRMCGVCGTGMPASVARGSAASAAPGPGPGPGPDHASASALFGLLEEASASGLSRERIQDRVESLMGSIFGGQRRERAEEQQRHQEELQLARDRERAHLAERARDAERERSSRRAADHEDRKSVV